jgi:phage host-nuclease inhibitor protein Gam
MSIAEFEVTDPEDSEIIPTREPFKIDNDGKADWAMRHLAASNAKKAENARLYESEVHRLQVWLERANRPIESEIQFFEGSLTQYASSERAENDRKTLDLPHGKVKSRLVPAKFVVEDKVAFLDWAKVTKNESLIRVTEAPDAKAMNESLTKTDGVVLSQGGEIVPGVSVTQESINFSFETD